MKYQSLGKVFLFIIVCSIGYILYMLVSSWLPLEILNFQFNNAAVDYLGRFSAEESQLRFNLG
jgi:hypothetical protein